MTEAHEFVRQHHRHSRVRACGTYAVACAEGEIVRGVAIVGHPVARMLNDGWTAEVTRLTTDGTANVCSMLYGACWRIARDLGYRKLVTYTLDSEPGVSVAAAGWRKVAEVRGRSWHCPSRPRVNRNPLQDKFRWEIGETQDAPPPKPATVAAEKPLELFVA